MKKDLIFDIGGVLIGFRVFEMLADYGLDRESSERVANEVFDEQYWSEFDRGTINFEEIKEFYKNKYPEDAEHIEYFLVNCELIKINRPKVWEYVIKLKSMGYRIYLLSNYSEKLLKMHTADIPFMDDVDGKVISYQVHSVKPEEDIYKILLNKYNLNPENCVFFDDRKDNTDAAAKLGIETYTIESESHLLGILDKYMIV